MGTALTEQACEVLLDRFDACQSNATETLLDSGFEPLTAGFANTVCAATYCGQAVVLKRYKALVFLRLSEHAVGAVDVLAGAHGVGPHVFLSSKRGLITQMLPGKTLEETDVHGPSADAEQMLGRAASAVAFLHGLSPPPECEGAPMLWRTIDKMMEVAARRTSPWPPQLPRLDAMRTAISQARVALDQLCPAVVLGHGDLKPSNIIASDGDLKLIDFELGGPNYRGFDLMKLFRTERVPSAENMRFFMETYARQSGLGASDDIVRLLIAEARQFEPLTWLEAAVFFVALPEFRPDAVQRWDQLAGERWAKFEETRHLLSKGTGGSNAGEGGNAAVPS